MPEKKNNTSLWNYKELIWNFAINEIKIKHRNSFLGFWWAILEPLLLLTVLYFIFTYINVKPIENFAIYLFTGLIFWSFFTRSTNFAVISIIQKSQVFKKIYLPREIPAISSCVTAGILLIVELTILAFFLAAYGIVPGITILLLPVIIIIECVLALGIGIPLSIMNVLRRDVHRLWTVIMQGAFFLLPIFYTYDNLPENLRNLLSLIPTAQIIMMARNVIMYDSLPDIYQFTYTIAVTSIVFIMGYVIFKKLEKGAIEEL